MDEKYHVHRPLTTLVQDAEYAENLYFPFIPKAFGINGNHPKLRFIWFVSHNAYISIKPMIRWVPDTFILAITLPEGLGFISFRPLSEKK